MIACKINYLILQGTTGFDASSSNKDESSSSSNNPPPKSIGNKLNDSSSASSAKQNNLTLPIGQRNYNSQSFNFSPNQAFQDFVDVFVKKRGGAVVGNVQGAGAGSGVEQESEDVFDLDNTCLPRNLAFDPTNSKHVE